MTGDATRPSAPAVAGGLEVRLPIEWLNRQ